jgi:hypothetical protein
MRLRNTVVMWAWSTKPTAAAARLANGDYVFTRLTAMAN